jgi:hypothetical protein
MGAAFYTDGQWSDIEQGPQEYCWAAAAANALHRAGWQTPAADTAAQIDDEFRAHWTPGAGLMNHGWWWWFDGHQQPPSGGATPWATVNGGGNHWPAAAFLEHYAYWGNWNPLDGIKTYLNQGYEVTIAAYPGFDKLGHAFVAYEIGRAHV